MPREDTQFKPGQTGNPAGRPKGSPGKRARALGWKFVAEVFERLFIDTEADLLKWIAANKHKMSRAEKVFLKHSEDLKHLNSLLDRVVGVPTKVEFKTDDETGMPIQFNIIRHSKHRDADGTKAD